MESIDHKGRLFTIIIQKEDEGGFCGQCLEIPGVISQGESLDELKKNISKAIRMTLEYLKDKAKNENHQLISINA